MRLGEIEEVRYPNRRPWLILVLLLAAGAVYFYRTQRQKRADRRPPAEVEQVSGTEPGAAADAPRRKDTPSGPANGPHVDVTAALAEARAAEDGGERLRARGLYLQVLKARPAPGVRRAVEERLGELHMRLVASPEPMPEKVTVEIARGDSLARIARRHGTTVELLQAANNIGDPNRIRVGDRLRVLNGTFAMVISKSRNDLVLSLNGQFFKRYRVGTGKYDKTPEGTFVITDRIKEPVWWPSGGREVPYTGDPEGENILGTRWMALKAVDDTPDVVGYGIHGTWDESTIGKAESAGCIRLRNRDVEELFRLIPSGTRVRIEK